MAEELTLSVELPGRRGSSLAGGPRPRAMLVIVTPSKGEERLSVPVAVGRILDAKLKAGELHPSSRAEALFLLREQSLACARSRVEKLIDRRDYSSHELGEKLKADGFGPSVREAVVARAVEASVVDDERYASSLVRTKLSAGWGRRRIEQELRRRGIEPAGLEGWPDAFFEDEPEDERAYELVRRRRIPERNAYEKFVRYLCSKGYGTGCAMRVTRRVLDEREHESQEG